MIIGKDQRFLTIEGDLMVKMGYDSKNYTGKHAAEIGSVPEDMKQVNIFMKGY